MALGKRLRKARKTRNYTQKELAERAGKPATQAAISALEKRDSLTCKFARALASALEVRLEWLMDNKGRMDLEVARLRPLEPDDDKEVLLLADLMRGWSAHQRDVMWIAARLVIEMERDPSDPDATVDDHQKGQQIRLWGEVQRLKKERATA